MVLDWASDGEALSQSPGLSVDDQHCCVVRTEDDRVVLRGSEVAREDRVFCPIDDDRMAFYALTPQKLRAALPAGWKREEMSATRLSTGQRYAAVFDVADGFIEVGVDVRQPVIVYRHTGMPGSR